MAGTPQSARLLPLCEHEALVDPIGNGSVFLPVIDLVDDDPAAIDLQQ